MRRAERVGLRALDVDLDELGRAFAVAHDLQARSRSTPSSAARNSASRRSVGACDRGAPRRRCAGREQQQRVGGRGVAVDGDGVEGVATPREMQRLQHGAGNRRVGEDEGQHRRHVRRDHARALGDAVDGDGACRRCCAVAVATLGKVSVVMIALAASNQRSGRRRPGAGPCTPSNVHRHQAARRSRRWRRGTPRAGRQPTAFAAEAAVTSRRRGRSCR